MNAFGEAQLKYMHCATMVVCDHSVIWGGCM